MCEYDLCVNLNYGWGDTHTHTHTQVGAGPSKKPQSQLKSIKQYLVKTEYLTKDFI